MRPPVSASDFPSFHDVDPLAKPFTCTHLTKQSRRCLNPIDIGLLTTTSAIKREIKAERSREKRDALLLKFISNCCCKRDHRPEVTGTPLAQSLLQRWDAELPSLPELMESGVRSPLNPRTDTIPSPLENHVKPSSTIVDRPNRTSRPHLRSDGPVTEVPSPSTGGRFSETTFQPMAKKKGKTLVWQLCKPLTDFEDRQPGGIYIFSKESGFGMVKIGRSTNIPSRMRQFKSDCGYYPDLKHSISNVSHASKIEKLVHCELLYCRHTETGCICRVGKHVEWFMCSFETARQSMNNFARWMEEADPYETDAGGSLKPEWRIFIQRMEREGQKLTSQLLLDEMERRQREARALIRTPVEVPVEVVPPKHVVPQPPSKASTPAPLLSRDIEDSVMAAIRDVLSSNVLQGTALLLAPLIQTRLRAL